MSENPRLVLAVGLPGSGKSSYLASLGVNAVSTDAIRLLLADDAADQSINGRVFASAKYLVQQRLELRRPITYLDATNLTRHDRQTWIQLARTAGAGVEALWFNVPLSICKSRNALRTRVVLPQVLDLMAAKFVPPSVEEGLDAIGIVEV